MAVTAQQLNQFLNQHFSSGELRSLCFELNIPYEDLEGGESRSAKVLALVQYAQRHGLFDVLATNAQSQRPNARLGDMSGTAQPATASAPTTQTPVAPVYNITVQGNMVGAAIGGTLTAQNIAGGDIYIGPVPQTRDEFAEQLKQLQALLQEAIAAQEIPNSQDAETLTDDLQDVVKEVQAEQPRNGRISRRLQDMTEIVDNAGKVAEAAGKTGTFILKAAPILAGLAKAVQVLF
jgi:hypothetical protein